jgi:hypothetical protein
MIEGNSPPSSGSNKPSKIPASKPRLVSYSDYSTLKMEAMFLRNVGSLSRDYTALYARRYFSMMP